MKEEAAPEKPVKTRRQVWRWVIVVVVLMSLAFAGVKGLTHSRYSFLLDLGPTQVVYPGPFVTNSPSSPDYHLELLYYKKEAAPKVLSAIEHELTSAQGFDKQVHSFEGMRMFWFTYGKLPNQFGVLYSDGSPYILSTLKDSETLPRMEPGGCLVLIAAEPSWWQIKWKALRKFVGLAK